MQGPSSQVHVYPFLITQPARPASQPQATAPPQGTGDEGEEGVGVEEEEIGLDGWLKLSEITTEPLH